jgi:hypothetical protein
MTDIEALAKEVRYLRDLREIEDCIYRYCRGLDRLDREMALSAYHPDAKDDRGHGKVRTAVEFVDFVFELLKKSKGTAHCMTNIRVDIDGDVAHAESYVTFHVWALEDDHVALGSARYLDRLERRNGKWGIAYREALMDYRSRLEHRGLLPGTLTGQRETREDRSYARPLQPKG